ncbi:hypothetical protein DFH11DRAFT_1734398 [Phellopilus nigrolimitatus]|nr:hypothetical protein DFH11DRAFT_1734398 [Phellopilus nigrolimitatus]
MLVVSPSNLLVVVFAASLVALSCAAPQATLCTSSTLSCCADLTDPTSCVSVATASCPIGAVLACCTDLGSPQKMLAVSPSNLLTTVFAASLVALSCAAPQATLCPGGTLSCCTDIFAVRLPSGFPSSQTNAWHSRSQNPTTCTPAIAGVGFIELFEPEQRDC